MATWKYNSLAVSTLASGISSGATSLSVQSGDGAKYPTAGDFWLHIHVAGSYGEIAKGTARTSDSITISRGQEGTTAVAHNGGELVELIVSAASLDQLRQDIHQTGADASKSAEKAGNIYLPNNGYQLYRDTGSVFAPWGPLFPFVPPVDSEFAWVNQGGASVTTTNGGIHLHAPAGSGNNMRIRKKAAPATPYTITAGFLPMVGPANYSGCGLCFRQSSDNKLHILNWQCNNTLRFIISKMTSHTAFDAVYAECATGNLGANPMWMRIADNGTDRKCFISANGRNWIEIHTVLRENYLIADEVGFFAESNNSGYDAGMTLLHWEQA